MPILPGPLLVDTNVILECHRTVCWRALSQRYPVETVETCVEETQTGFQNRRPEQRIDQAALQQSLKAVHQVSNQDIAAVVLRDPSVAALDPGEKHLWAHAFARNDIWILCGPDAASLRVGLALGFRERLVALEALLEAIGHRPGSPLRRQYTKKWHEEKMAQFLFSRPRGA